MKTGILTFHWSTNYGAVLQAYALQRYLSNCDYNAEIINYTPIITILKQYLMAIKRGDLNYFIEEARLKRFRRHHLLLTGKHFFSNKALKKNRFDYQYIFAGSDQIWNESFTLRGEGKPTLSYYLDFANSNTKRVAYAASFGFEKVTSRYIATVEKEIKKFSAISVREKDGVDIVGMFGLPCTLVCDPTALLSSDEYTEIAKKSKKKTDKVFAYILREKQADAWKTAQYTGTLFGAAVKEAKFKGSMEDWLHSIVASDIVVTNSFHGVLLSLILNRPFIALTTKGTGMNSRLTTLLSNVGLETRLIDSFSEERVKEIAGEQIDWTSVNRCLSSLKLTGTEFIKMVMEQLA